MPKTPKAPSKKTLKKAAGLLQAAHDQIEAIGFDIDRYGFDSEVQDGKLTAPMCYIGTVRALAGVQPEPPTNPDLAYESFSSASEDAGYGDGPELILALEAMDKVAKRRLKRGFAQKPDEYTIKTGRFVEALGFQVQFKACEKYPYPEDIWRTLGPERDEVFADIETKRSEFEKAYALRLLRRALTEIYG